MAKPIKEKRYASTGQLIRRYPGIGGQVDVVLNFSRYMPNRRVALQLIAVENNSPVEPLAVASVNLPEEAMAPDEIAIKNWSENEGMLDWLVEQGIVAVPHREVRSGYVNVPICKLLVTRDEQIEPDMERDRR